MGERLFQRLCDRHATCCDNRPLAAIFVVSRGENMPQADGRIVPGASSIIVVSCPTCGHKLTVCVVAAAACTCPRRRGNSYYSDEVVVAEGSVLVRVRDYGPLSVEEARGLAKQLGWAADMAELNRLRVEKPKPHRDGVDRSGPI